MMPKLEKSRCYPSPRAGSGFPGEMTEMRTVTQTREEINIALLEIVSSNIHGAR